MNEIAPAVNIDRNILENSYYVIEYFNGNDKEVTNLKIQKLMYFLEAIYMVITKEDHLFDTPFYAWAYGPVSKILYDQYRAFESYPIELSEEEKQLGRNISSENKKYIEVLFKLFGDMKASELVDLTHIKSSPWYELYNKERDSEQVNLNVEVNKIATREWFKEFITIVEK